VPMLPIAAFLAGALLSLLLPTGVLIALAVWHFFVIRRVPDTEATKSGVPPSAPASQAEIREAQATIEGS
jgi:hypothetical protein